MGKPSKTDTSKSKSQKSVKAAPTWREKLAEYDINNVCAGRTCEVILMAELTIDFSEAIALFDSGSKNNLSSVIKSINFNALMNEIKESKQVNENKPEADKKAKGDKSKSKSDAIPALFQSAATEANEILKTNEPVSLELTAQLIKLKIITMINEDVALRDEERRLELEKLNQDNTDRAGKKAKTEKDTKKGKGKSKTAINLPVEERKLYILLSGFYKPNLVQELLLVGIPLRAILELANPDAVFTEKYTPKTTPEASFVTPSDSLTPDKNNPEENDEEVILFINQYYGDSKDSVCISTPVMEETEASISSSIQNKINELYYFWNQIYEELEGELQSTFLENTAHIRATPVSVLCADKDPQEVFLEISKEVLKLPGVKRQHLNYLRHVKIWEVEEKEDVPQSSLKIYKKLMDVVPPDCFTIGLFLHCLLEEVSSRVPNPKPPPLKPEDFVDTLKFPTCSQENCQKDLILKSENPINVVSSIVTPSKINTTNPGKLKESVENDKSLENLADYVIQFRKTRSPFCETGITYHENKFSPKMHLEISNKPFIIHETSWLEFKLNSYRQLSQQLLKINLDILKKCPAALLWQLYPRLRPIEIVYKKYQLESWGRLVNMTIDDIVHALSAIGFNMLTCSTSSKKDPVTKDSFQILFPGKNDSEILKRALPKVKYIQTPEISLTTLMQRKSCIEIPNVTYSNFPNVYEAKNIQNYLWYEELSPVVMLQQLEKANLEYICVDHKYCPYSDAITLRYHNNVDMFGINSKIWTESLRTPVCFRDFCKYITHEEAQWLEKEEDAYQAKLREDRKKHPPEEIPKANEEISKDAQQRTHPPEKVQKPNKEVTKDPDQNTKKAQTTFTEKPSNFCAKHGEAFSFLAYDVSEARVQLTGATTTFHSLDGYKIIVDRTNFIVKPINLSLNLSLGEHNLIFHFNKSNPNEPLMFHFYLSDGTIIVFSKPPSMSQPEINIAEKSYKTCKPKSKTDTKTAFRPRNKNFYYVTEKKRCYLKTVTVPFVTRQGSLLPEDRAVVYLEQMKKFNFISSSKKGAKRKTPPKFYDISPDKPGDPKEVLTLYMASQSQKDDTESDEYVDVTKAEGVSETSMVHPECTEILKKIEEAKKLQVPRFRVFSTKLHKFEYVKRAKSYIHITIGKHTIPLLCKHPVHKISREIEVVKVFPIKLTSSTFFNNNVYDMKTSLPSSLLIHTLAGVESSSLNIKQRYLEKGPQCRKIANEHSRTFMRDGHVVIKKTDGTLDVMAANGQIVHCEIPHSTIKTQTKYKIKGSKETNCAKGKKLLRVVNWRRRHIIGEAEARYFKFRRIYIRNHKRQFKKSEIYVTQKNPNSTFAFTLITPDGKQLKVTEANVQKQGKIFQTILEDPDYEEQIFLRDDGTKSLLHGGGILTTQYVDQTKISSWFAEAPQPVIIFEDLDELNSYDSFQFYEMEEWVLVQIFYKFEHPYYATVLYSSDSSESEINLPNGVVINITESGHYFLDLDGIVSSVINDQLVYLELRSCDTCLQRSITVLNLKPLYDRKEPIAEDTELLKTCDSYEKIFVVNYNGKCFRNSNYIRHRANRVECEHHDREDHQLLFVLNRDLSGSKFWDVKAYRKRMMEVTYNNDTVIQYYGTNASAEDYTCLELRTHERQPYHASFVNQSFINDVVLSSYQTSCNPLSPAYTTFCRIHRMPKQCMIDLLQASMIENSKLVEFPKPDHNATVCRCISQIGREDIKLKESPVIEEHYKKSTSALSLFKRWYTWHELNQPYVPPTPDQICQCKSDPFKIKLEKVRPPKLYKKFSAEDKLIDQTTSLEVLADRISSYSITSTYQKPHSTVCECHLLAHFMCNCKPVIATKSKEDVEFVEAETEEQFGEDANMEAMNRISSINKWSNEVEFLDNVYVLGEESQSYADVVGKSVSDTAVQKEIVSKSPPCQCNTRKYQNQSKPAPKSKHRNICAEDSCKQQKHSKLTSIKECSEVSRSKSSFERQAGGEDPPKHFLSVKRSNTAVDLQKQYCFRKVQEKIIKLISSTTNKCGRYEMSLANDVVQQILQANFNSSELLEVLQKLNKINVNKCKTLSAGKLSRFILSQFNAKNEENRVRVPPVANFNFGSKFVSNPKLNLSTPIRTKQAIEQDKLTKTDTKRILPKTKYENYRYNKNHETGDIY